MNANCSDSSLFIFVSAVGGWPNGERELIYSLITSTVDHKLSLIENCSLVFFGFLVIKKSKRVEWISDEESFFAMMMISLGAICLIQSPFSPSEKLNHFSLLPTNTCSGDCLGTDSEIFYLNLSAAQLINVS